MIGILPNHVSGAQICSWVSDCPELYYCKSPKFSDAQNVWCSHPKIQTKRLYHSVMHPKDADSIANSEDPDQTAPPGAVCSGSALFA